MEVDSKPEPTSKLGLKEQLENILETLLEEIQEMREFYTTKISQLYDEIADKDCKINNLEKTLDQTNSNLSRNQHQLQQQQLIINRLHKLVTTNQARFTDTTAKYVSPAKQTTNDSKIDLQKLSNRKINISEYFIKSHEKYKLQKQIYSQSSTFSTLQHISSGKLSSHNKKDQEPEKLNLMKKQKGHQHTSQFELFQHLTPSESNIFEDRNYKTFDFARSKKQLKDFRPRQRKGFYLNY